MNKSSARKNIFDRLYRSRQSGKEILPDIPPWEPESLEKEERIKKFMELMTAVRSEVYRLESSQLTGKLQELLAERKVSTMVYGPETALGKSLEQAWEQGESQTKLIPWQDTIEDFRDELFTIDAGITTTMGGIAEAGALIVWPTPQEPRLMSLVPPIHFAVVSAEDIYNSFNEAMRKLDWAEKSPTNALLISGPSKTADIELILQFGVHGPTDLIVFVVE